MVLWIDSLSAWGGTRELGIHSSALRLLGIYSMSRFVEFTLHLIPGVERQLYYLQPCDVVPISSGCVEGEKDGVGP